MLFFKGGYVSGYLMVSRLEYNEGKEKNGTEFTFHCLDIFMINRRKKIGSIPYLQIGREEKEGYQIKWNGTHYINSIPFYLSLNNPNNES